MYHFITSKAIYPSFATDKAINEMLKFLGLAEKDYTSP